jgi:hypothetical protein
MRALVLALTIASQAGGPAFAGGTGIVVVAPHDQRPAATAAMVEAVRQGGAVRIVADALGAAREAVAAGAVPLQAMVEFRRVREMIEAGWRAYHNVQLELAAQQLVAARIAAERLLALPGMTALYADASLRLGAVLAQLGRTAEAYEATVLALALDPDRPITQLEFSPEVVAAIDAVRAQPRANHAVRVTSEPGASIVIDGVAVGHPPVALELALGQHIVIARAPRFQPRARAFAIDERGSSAAPELELALPLAHDEAAEELALGVELGMPDRAAQGVTDQLLELGDLDDVVLVVSTERRGGPTLFAQRCAGAPARCSAVVELGYADRSGVAAAARSVWQAVRAADLRYPPTLFGDPRLTGALVDHGCKVCRSPILWAGLGAAAIVTTIVIIAVATSSRPPPILTVDPGRF